MNQPEQCSSCGSFLPEGAAACPVCGNTHTPVKQPVCTNCGAQLNGKDPFCSNCGARVSQPAAAASIPNTAAYAQQPVAPYAPAAQPYAPVNQPYGAPAGQPYGGQTYVPYGNTPVQPKSRNKTGLIIGCIAGGLVALIVFSIVIGSIVGSSGTDIDFHDIYAEYCSPLWAEVGSDGSYLFIDTNPYNYDDSGVYYSNAYKAIEKINNALDLPSSLFKEMGETSSNDGKQTRTYGDLTVTWKYHPDKGLEVTYRIDD